MDNEELQYTYFPISQEVKAISQKLGQLIEYKVKIFFFENHAKNDVGRLDPDLFLTFKIYLK